jgi:hypothetical protein
LILKREPALNLFNNWSVAAASFSLEEDSEKSFLPVFFPLYLSFIGPNL